MASVTLTGYGGGLSRWGGDGDGDVDCIGTEPRLACQREVLLVVRVLLLVPGQELAPGGFGGADGRAAPLHVRVPSPVRQSEAVPLAERTKLRRLWAHFVIPTNERTSEHLPFQADKAVSLVKTILTFRSAQ